MSSSFAARRKVLDAGGRAAREGEFSARKRQSEWRSRRRSKFGGLKVTPQQSSAQWRERRASVRKFVAHYFA